MTISSPSSDIHTGNGVPQNLLRLTAQSRACTSHVTTKILQGHLARQGHPPVVQLTAHCSLCSGSCKLLVTSREVHFRQNAPNLLRVKPRASLQHRSKTLLHLRQTCRQLAN